MGAWQERTLNEFRQKTAREAWLFCKYGYGFKAIVKAMIERRWTFNDCKLVTMRTFLQNQLKELSAIGSNEFRALKTAEITSLELLSRVSFSDVKSHVRNMGPERNKLLQFAMGEKGLSFQPD